jgi:hypothetical protein
MAMGGAFMHHPEPLQTNEMTYICVNKVKWKCVYMHAHWYPGHMHAHNAGVKNTDKDILISTELIMQSKCMEL